MSHLVLLACSVPHEIVKAWNEHYQSSYYSGIAITVASLLVFQVLFPKNRGLALIITLGLQSSNIIHGYQNLDMLIWCNSVNIHAIYLNDTAKLLFSLTVIAGGALIALALTKDKYFGRIKRHFYWLRPKNI